MAIFAGEMIENGILTPLALAGALAGLLLSAVAGLLAELQAARAETKLVSRLRNELDAALAGMPAARINTRSAGALIAGLRAIRPRLPASSSATQPRGICLQLHRWPQPPPLLSYPGRRH